MIYESNYNICVLRATGVRKVKLENELLMFFFVQERFATKLFESVSNARYYLSYSSSTSMFLAGTIQITSLEVYGLNRQKTNK